MELKKKGQKVLLITGEYEDKIAAHVKGLQHYAFSIIIFNKKGQMLLQKRDSKKYHSGNLWTNSCCSHPLTTEVNALKIEARKRLEYELGISTKLEIAFVLSYRGVCSGLTENEVDYVLYGYSNEEPNPNKSEVMDYKWCYLSDVISDIEKNPSIYTLWFKHIILDYMEEIKIIKKMAYANK